MCIGDRYNGYRDVSALPAHISDEMTHFFEVYKTLEHKKTTVRQVDGRDDATMIIQNCLKEYNCLLYTSRLQRQDISSAGKQGYRW